MTTAAPQNRSRFQETDRRGGRAGAFRLSPNAARGHSLRAEDATPIGPGCARCRRPECMQRSLPPQGVALKFDDRARGLTPFVFGG